MLIEASNSLLPIVTSLRGPTSAALDPAVASTEAMLPAVAIVEEPVELVCLTRIVPAAEVEPVVSVSFVSSASETVIHAVTEPDSELPPAVPAPLYRSAVVPALPPHGTGNTDLSNATEPEAEVTVAVS